MLVDDKLVDEKLKSYGHEQELQADTDVAEPDHGKEAKASERGMQTAELRSALLGEWDGVCVRVPQSPWRGRRAGAGSTRSAGAADAADRARGVEVSDVVAVA